MLCPDYSLGGMKILKIVLNVLLKSSTYIIISINKKKKSDFRFLKDLHVLRCPEHKNICLFV